MLMAEQWDSFARAVLSPGTPPIQRQEMRKAFYAGAQGIMFGVIGCLSGDRESTEEDVQVIRDLQQELADFSELVRTGRA
jgi:biotin synthase-like enzyme